MAVQLAVQMDARMVVLWAEKMVVLLAVQMGALKVDS